MKQFRYSTMICFLALLLSPESLPGAERVIGAASSLTTIFPVTPLAADAIDQEMTLKAAQGETESGQVVIVAGDQALKFKRVEVSDLLTRRRTHRQRQHRSAASCLRRDQEGREQLARQSAAWTVARPAAAFPALHLSGRGVSCDVGEGPANRVAWKVRGGDTGVLCG